MVSKTDNLTNDQRVRLAWVYGVSLFQARRYAEAGPELRIAAEHASFKHCKEALPLLAICMAQDGDPVGADHLYHETGKPQGRGTWQPPHERWPMYVFDRRGTPDPPPYDPEKYRHQYDPEKYPVTPYTPETLRCPTDVDPVEAHTYVLNGIAAQRYARAGSGDWGSLTFSEVILAFEKYTQQRDYYLEDWKSFDKVVDPYRHGPRLFSNYLFFDGHVSSLNPKLARRALNPWTETAVP